MNRPFYPHALSAFALLVVIMASLSSCRKDDYNTSPDLRLSFSTDSVNFDTVFTTIGQATRRFQIYNTDGSFVNISKIRLANDANNSFRINVDGLSGTEFNDIEIGPDDSLFVFVEVTVEPNSNLLYPFVEGEVLFEVNGNTQSVKLVAWGWDAVFYVPNVFPTNGLPDFRLVAPEPNANVVWTADRPIVVFGYVVVDSTQTLTIEPGTQVYFHQGSGLWVYREGQITAAGTPEAPIVFQGDRLEPFYEEQPGQWDRIWINEGLNGSDNTFTNCIIKNNFIGIQAETLPFSYNADAGLSANTLKLTNVAIRNNSIAGLFTRNYRIEAATSLFTSGGQYLLAGTAAGQYNFDQCTFANNWRLSTRQTPALLITNFENAGNGLVAVSPIATSRFRNCIIYGNGFSEFLLDLDDSNSIDLLFQNCLYRVDEDLIQGYIDNGYIDGGHVNANPGFIDFSQGDMRLMEDAYARGKGLEYFGQPATDLIGTPFENPRALGCLEYLME